MRPKNDYNPGVARLARELEARRRGFKLVIGADEAGRGPWAGPVVAAAVSVVDPFVNDVLMAQLFVQVSDSKKISAMKRERLYGVLTQHRAVRWGVASVGAAVIDRVNILEASRIAMGRAIANLVRKECFVYAPKDVFCFIDGNKTVRTRYRQEAVVGGDDKIFSVSAASIIAKVTRDRLMAVMDARYSGYGFGKHKGYGTSFHREALERFGPCPIHRRSFAPIINAAKRFSTG